MSQIVFGNFLLDVPARTLWHRDALVEIHPKEFDVLLLLATARGDAVSKDTILDDVWRSAEATEAALTQCVYRLRQTLARHDPCANHIATIPGLGYRFASQ